MANSKHESMTIAEYRALSSRPRRKRLDQYDSDREAIWARLGRTVLEAQTRRMVNQMQHHPMRLHIAGGHYRPDFRAIGHKDGESPIYYLIEVKGSRKVKNYRDARSKLRAAAEMFPEYTFIEARLASTSRPLDWELEIIG